MEFEDEFESKALIASDSDHKLRLKDVVDGKQTLAFQLKPKVRLLFSLILFCIWSVFGNTSHNLFSFQGRKEENIVSLC